MAGTAQLTTLGDVVLSLLDKANLKDTKEAAGIAGKVISDQFGHQQFSQTLPKVFPSTYRHKTDGRILGPWLEAVSTSDSAWDEEYTVNFISLWSNFADSKPAISNTNSGRIPFAEQPDASSFLEQIASLPQPLMRNFQTDLRSLSNIFNIAKHTAMGHDRSQRTETLWLRKFFRRVKADIGKDASAEELKDWLTEDRNVETHPAGIHDIEVRDDGMIIFHREGQKPLRRKFKTIWSNYYKK